MGNTHAAEKIFWELVEDFDEWTRLRLALLRHDANAPAEKSVALAQTTTYLVNATAQACKCNWEGAASACKDMAAAALNLLGPGEFAAAKDLIWDMALAAHIAAGKHGETFPEVQRALLKDLGTTIGNKAFAFVNPVVVGHPAPAY
jgi:hypothetical protein